MRHIQLALEFEIREKIQNQSGHPSEFILPLSPVHLSIG